jgi:hypothetical protein
MCEPPNQPGTEPVEQGHPTPEAAAVLGFPPQYVTVLGTVINGDRADVWLLTNDQPPFEPYVIDCYRTETGWLPSGGNNGFGGAPADVIRAAAKMGYYP